MKEHIYSTDEYEVKIGDPVVDAEVKASSTSVAIPCEAIPDGKYLVSLEVNGTAVAFRDTFSFASGSCTVGDYTLAYSSYSVTVSTTSNNDVVRLKIEPVEVYVTDAMKAAVVEVSPPSPNELPAVTSADAGKVLAVNDSGVWGAQEPSGGALYVEVDNNDNTSHSATEIKNALDAGSAVFAVYKGIIYSCYNYDNLNDDAYFIGLSSVGMLRAYSIDNSKEWYSTNVDNRGNMVYYLTASVITLTFSTASDGNMSEYNSKIAQYYEGSRTVIFKATINGETIWSSLTKVTYLSGYTYPRMEVDFGDYIAVCAESNAQSRAFTLIPKDNRFIVTLTPTYEDYSGTMDKTVAEINAAYEAGQQIVFRVRYDQVGSYLESSVCVLHSSGAQNEGFLATVCYNNMLIVATTGENPSPDSTTYHTVIFPLTPAT